MFPPLKAPIKHDKTLSPQNYYIQIYPGIFFGEGAILSSWAYFSSEDQIPWSILSQLSDTRRDFPRRPVTNYETIFLCGARMALDKSRV